jgi:L-malate glycosyltransferase
MIKVLFYESRPEWGGAQKCELELMVGLEKHNMETLFITSTEGPMLERVQFLEKEFIIFPIHSKIDSIRKDNVRSGFFSKISLGLLMLPHFIKLMKFIKETKPDIIYTSQFRSQLFVGWLGKILGKKVVWHIHGEERLDNLLGQIALRTSDHRIVVSKILCENYQSRFPPLSSTFSAVPNGVEVYERKIKTNSDVIHLVTVGALIEGKRQDLAIKACKELIDRGYSVHLHIVGEKPHWHSQQYKNDLLHIVKENNFQSHITFHGWVENPHAILAKSDIFLLPSDTEGLPLSIIEAMGVGLPSIATNVGGIPELIVNEETGLLIAKDSLEDLVASIVRLVENQELREQMGKAARSLYETTYTKKAFLEGVAGVLRTVQK